jgi:hypothetical protein
MKPKKKKEKQEYIVPRTVPVITEVIDMDGKPVAVGDRVSVYHYHLKSDRGTTTQARTANSRFIKGISREFGGVSVILENGFWLSCVADGDKWRCGGRNTDGREWGLHRITEVVS